MKRKGKRRRGSRLSLLNGLVMGCMTGGMLFCADPISAASTQKTTDAGESSAEKKVEFHIDVESLPDPFLSYFIRREQRVSREAEEAKRKRLEAEARLERKKREIREQLEDLKKPRTELQTLNLGQLTLTAIIKTGIGYWAMVRDPKGQGHILKKGTRVGTDGGIVSHIAISEKKVIIKEPYITEDELHIEYKPVELGLPEDLY